MEYPYAWLHVGRTPGENTEDNYIKVPEGKGGVFHWQFSDWERFQMKQSWLRCSELIKYPDNVQSINEKYRITLDPPRGEALVKLAPKSWYENIILPDVNDASDENRLWRLHEMLEWFEEYGLDYFAELDIGHMQPLINRYIKKWL